MFVAEHVPEKRIGIACGTLTSRPDGWHSVGVGGGDAYQHQPDAAGDPRRRLADPFLLGGVFGLIAMYLRRWLQETPIFLEMQQRKTLAQELPVKAVALKRTRRRW